MDLKRSYDGIGSSICMSVAVAVAVSSPVAVVVCVCISSGSGKVHFVVAHCREDLTWLQTLPLPATAQVYIYEKCALWLLPRLDFASRKLGGSFFQKCF